MRVPPFKKHIYDVDIMELYFKAKNYFDKYPNPTLSEKYLTTFLEDTKKFSKQNDYDFDYHYKIGNMVVVDSKSDSFSYFFSYMLAIEDILKINLILNHHLKYFKGNCDAKANNFVGLIEFRIYDLVKRHSLFNTQSRMEKIMRWIEEKKTQIGNLADILTCLEWNGDLAKLKKLSNEVRLKDFTKNSTDFEKVFTDHRPTNWLKEPEFLAYLLNQLYNKPLKQIKVSPPGKGYLKVAEEFFYDYSKKSKKKIRFADLKYNVVKRHASKHQLLRTRVDSMLSEIFK